MRDSAPRGRVTDVHCHLDRFDDPAGVAGRAAEAGVEIFYVSFLPSDYAAGGVEGGGAANVSRGLGFHPMASRGFFPWIERIDIDRECGLFPELSAGAPWIGEIGLDFMPDGAPFRDVQERMLDAVLSAPGVADRFMTVHSRDAVDELLAALQAAGVSRAAFHGNGFTGGVPEIEAVLEAGYSFSLVPSMFFHERGRAVIAAVPRERMLVETDAPFGIVEDRAIEPAELGDPVARLAVLWGCDPDEVEDQLAANLARLLEGTPAAAR